MSKSSAEKSGIALRATCEAVKQIVAAIHSGRVESHPVPTSLFPARTSYAPSFIQGRAPESGDSKPYNAPHLSVLLGNYLQRSRKPHQIVKLALLLLELRELEQITDADMEEIFRGDDEFSQQTLRRILTRTREEYHDLLAQEEAIAIFQSV